LPVEVEGAGGRPEDGQRGEEKGVFHERNGFGNRRRNSSAWADSAAAPAAADSAADQAADQAAAPAADQAADSAADQAADQAADRAADPAADQAADPAAAPAAAGNLTRRPGSARLGSGRLAPLYTF
jgi:hypothetical protein